MEAHPDAETAPPGRRGIHAALLAAAFSAESCLFLMAARRHSAWAYPRWYDQQAYLSDAYAALRRSARDGFVQGAIQALGHVSPQGSLHGFLALLALSLGGPPRLSALAVNLAAFLALQAATFLAARRLSGSYPIAWASAALLAALAVPWSAGPGSAADFRLDWMAACAFGVALAAALGGRALRSTPWAALFGAAVGGAVLVRFLTAAYFAPILGVALAWAALRPDRRARCARLALSAGVALAVCGPALWHARHAVFEYYWLGHFAGPERMLRDSHLGVVASLGQILSGLLSDQVGPAALLLGAGLAAGLLALGLWSGAGKRPQPGVRDSLADEWALALAFLAVPAAVLSVQPQKAPQTFGIMIPGVAWVFILAWSWLARRTGGRALAAACALASVAGAAVFTLAQAKGGPGPAMEREYRDVNALSDFLYFRSEESGLGHPRVAVTWLLDGLRAESFGIVGFERHGREIPFVATLPTGLYASGGNLAMAALAQSDFVCLVTRAAPSWPFDFEMAALIPAMRSWCDANLDHVGDMEEPEFSVSVYERKALLRPAGGVTLAGSMAAAQRGPAYARALPPAAPEFPRVSPVPGSTGSDFHYELRAAYSPVTYSAAGLPEGLLLDASNGAIVGHPVRAGEFKSVFTATNPAGSTVAELAVRIEGGDFLAVLAPADRCHAGRPVDIRFGAFSASGDLDFIDVTDLTAGRQLGRMEASEDQRTRWQGTYRATFGAAGTRTLLLRFVRRGAGADGKVSFVDRECEIDVAP